MVRLPTVDPVLYDRDDKGSLSRHEFKCFCTHALGVRPHRFEIDHLLDASGHIAFSEAAAFVAQYEASDNEVTKAIFEALDLEGRGFLTLDSVAQAFALASPAIKRDVVDNAFKELDVGKTGVITYQQFSWLTAVSEDDDLAARVLGRRY